MVQILNSIPDYRVSNSGIKQEDVQNTITKSKQAVSDNFESNSVSKTVSGNMTDPKNMQQTLLLLPPLYLLDKLVDKSIGKTGGKGLFDKAAKAGDTISHALHLDKLVSEETGSKISNFIKNNRFTKYFTKDYKAIPKSSFAKGMTLSDKYSQELFSALQGIASSETTAEILSNSGKTLSESTKTTLANILKDGASSTSVPADKLVSAADELISNGISEFGTQGLIPKKVSISEIKNKLQAANMQKGETAMGKMLAKGTLKTKDLLTFGGGLLSLAFAANAIVQTVKATKEAPKGEKKATFMHVLSEQYLGILLFQPSINMLYKAGGNKYRGMSVEARNALKELIQKANSNPNLTKEGYKIAKMQKDLLLRGVDKEKVAELTGKGLQEAKGLFKSLKNSGTKVKLWEKPLKAAGRLLDTGLDKINSPSLAGKAGGKLKGILGGLGRFAIIMFVLQPLLQKPLTKLCHKIFGEPKTYLEKHGDKSAKNDKNVNNAQSQSELQKILSGVPTDNVQVKDNGETNLLKRYSSSDINQEESQSNNEQISASQPMQMNADEDYSQPLKPQKTDDEIPALNLFKKSDSDERTYIPSIKVDNSSDKKREKEIEKDVNAFIKQKNRELGQKIKM